MRAEELEIKIVQGAKPGEGGQLPGHKVTDLIARLRHAVPGIPLISPPPHHDIYSIEDLAQLIHDLKTVNPRARVGRQAGRRGRRRARSPPAWRRRTPTTCSSPGTTAAPAPHRSSSIKHAGSPWELGLAETQHTLVRNGLRHRIEVRTDGGFKTGRDVVIAALLGAESYGFGTAPLVAMGCAMARQCHINTCPTGIATQREDLRAKFKGTPEQVIAYFTLVAEEVRAILAGMGFRALDEIIGRNDLLRAGRAPGGAARADARPLDAAGAARRRRPARLPGPRRRTASGTTGRDWCRSTRRSSRSWQPYLESGLPFSGSYPDPQPSPGGGRAGGGRDRRAQSATPACRRARCGSGSPAARARASARSPAGACTSSWRARRTTTSARD